MNPNDLAPGHNPDGLTIDQVGEGYRLTELEEAATLASDDRVDVWDEDDEHFYDRYDYLGRNLSRHCTHRVPITIPAPSRLGRPLPITEPLPPVPEGCDRMYATYDGKDFICEQRRMSGAKFYTDIQLPTTEHP